MSEKMEGPDNIPSAESVQILVNLGMELVKKTYNLNPEMDQQAPDQVPDQEMDLNGLKNDLSNILQNAFRIGRPEPGGPGAAQTNKAQDQTLISELATAMKAFFNNLKPESPKSDLDPASNLTSAIPQMLQGLNKTLTSVATNSALHGPSPSPMEGVSGPITETDFKDLNKIGAVKNLPSPQAEALREGLMAAEQAKLTLSNLSNNNVSEGTRSQSIPEVDPAAPGIPAGDPNRPRSPFSINIPTLKPPGSS